MNNYFRLSQNYLTIEQALEFVGDDKYFQKKMLVIFSF